MGFRLSFYRAVFISVFSVIGAAKIIPKIVVNAVILIVVFVMQVMVSRGVQDALKGFIQQVFMPKFVAGVSPHVDIEHEAVENPQPNKVRRY